MTLEEKASLTAGGDMMSTAPVERVGIPRINVTDGPNGARGPSYPGMGGPVSTCIPCGSALGATWDPVLIEQVLPEDASARQVDSTLRAEFPPYRDTPVQLAVTGDRASAEAFQSRL